MGGLRSAEGRLQPSGRKNNGYHIAFKCSFHVFFSLIFHSAKLQLFSETTKHFANFFRSFFTFLLFYLLFVIPDSDLSSGRAEWLPGYVQPAITRQHLIGMFAILEEIDQTLKLLRIFRADVGGLTCQMLGVTDTAHQLVHGLTTEPGVDDDGADGLSGWLQQHQATKVDVHEIRKRGQIIRVLLEVEKFAYSKVRREPYTAELFFCNVHDCLLSL